MVSSEEKRARQDWFDGLTPRQQRAWQKKKEWESVNSPEHNAALAERARKRMERVDSLPDGVRVVVYEHGLEIVWELWTYQIRRPTVMLDLIDAVRRAEDPYSNSVLGQFIARGIGTAKHARYLVDVILGADFPNGQRRFKLNKGPNTKRNMLDDDDDDEAYFVLGPAAL